MSPFSRVDNTETVTNSADTLVGDVSSSSLRGLANEVRWLEGTSTLLFAILEGQAAEMDRVEGDCAALGWGSESAIAGPN